MNVKRNATSLNNLECLEKSISTFSSVQDNKFDISNMENSFIFEKSFSFFFFFTPLSLVLKFFSFSGHDRCTSSPPSRIISSPFVPEKYSRRIQCSQGEEGAKPVAEFLRGREFTEFGCRSRPSKQVFPPFVLNFAWKSLFHFD